MEFPENVDAVILSRKAYMEGISIIPGELFSATQKYSHHIRLNCAVPLDRQSGMGLGADWATRNAFFDDLIVEIPWSCFECAHYFLQSSFACRSNLKLDQDSPVPFL